METYQQAEKNTAHNGGGKVQYQAKAKLAEHEKPIILQDITTLRSIKRKSINQFSASDIEKAAKWANRFYKEMGEKSPFFRAWFGDWRMHDISKVAVAEIPKYVGTNEARKANRGIVENSDTKWNIQISREGETNTISHSGTDHLSEYGLSGIQKLVEHAILLNTEVHEHHKNNPVNDLITFDHKLYALGENTDGEIGLYRITVEEYYQSKKEPANKKFHNLKYIEKIADITGGRTFGQNRSGGSTNGKPAITYTVADLAGFVKKYDAEYSAPPEVHADLINAYGTPKVVYHGSYSNFSIFDGNARKHSQAPVGAHFFTEDIDVGYSYTGYKDTAKPGGHAYQGGVYPVYLNIKNPYVVDFGGRHWTEKVNGMDVNETAEYAKKNGYDGVIIQNVIDEGGMGDKDWNEDVPRKPATDYVVFDSTQIKSATDNIGTFDGTNPDIRYQQRSETVTNREILANALESATKTDAERANLQKYRDDIQLIEKQEAKLKDLKSQIRELSFGKGPRDQKKIDALRFEAKQTENRINTLDKRLLKLEATDSLKALLEREKAAAYKKASEKSRAAAKQRNERPAVSARDLNKFLGVETPYHKCSPISWGRGHQNRAPLICQTKARACGKANRHTSNLEVWRGFCHSVAVLCNLSSRPA